MPLPPLQPSALTQEQQLAHVRDLAATERERGADPVPIGPFAAYLLRGALQQAARAPGLPASQVELAEQVAGNALEGMEQRARTVAEDLDVLGDAVGGDVDADSDAWSEYVAKVALIRDLEHAAEYRGVVHLGAYSAFMVVGLLQMVTRHPTFAPGSLGHDALIGFARTIQAGYSPAVQAIIESGFHPELDYVEDVEDAPER